MEKFFKNKGQAEAEENSQAGRIRKRASMLCVMMSVMILLSAVMIDSSMCFAVYVNGEEIGAIKSYTEASNVVTNAEARISELLGYDYKFHGDVSVSTALGGAEDAEALENALLMRVDELSRRYIIKVNGKTVGAVKDAKTVNNIFDGFYSRYKTEDTVSMRFADQVSVSYDFTPKTTLGDPVMIKSLLDPENPRSEYALRVERVEKQLYTESVPFETVYQEDPTMYEGDEKIITDGVEGKQLVTENTIYINGEQKARSVVSVQIMEEPVAATALRGTKERPLTASYGEYYWPANGEITSPFGYRGESIGSSNHQGMDIANEFETPVCAADGGTVIFAGYDDSYGNVVRIRHDNGDVTWYAHCNELLVVEGDQVFRGQQVGLMGETGLATGVHVHFELRLNGEEPVNPLLYLK